MSNYNFAKNVWLLDDINPYNYFRRKHYNFASRNPLARRYTKAARGVFQSILKNVDNLELFHELTTYRGHSLDPKTFYDDEFSKPLSKALPAPGPGVPEFIICGCDIRYFYNI